MPAFRGKNFRSGDIAEEFGLLLLQSVALVAPVPRTEDVGIDCVATLLRDFDSNRLLAEDSFYVQLKSSSVDQIEYSEAEVQWLRKLDLPFYVARISVQEANVELFADHALSRALVEVKNETRFQLVLNREPLKNDFETGVVHVGPPILRWTLSDTKRDDFRSWSYSVLKPHLRSSRKNNRTRGIGICDLVSWNLGEIPTVAGFQDSGHQAKTFDEHYGEVSEVLFSFNSACLRARDLEALDDWIGVFEHTREAIKAIDNKAVKKPRD